MNSLLFIFIIAALGYFLGSISFKGVQLGTAVVLIVALVFGHYGVVIDPIVKNFGLVLFVGSVGLIAGPVFFKNFQKKAFSYIILGALIVAFGVIATFATSKLFDIPGNLSTGIFNGALTSTPGLAAALELVNDPSVSIGYGVAYLFGVVGVVLFVQILPKILGKDIQKEAKEYVANMHKESEGTREKKEEHLKEVESSGLFVFALAMTLGILLGMIKIPVFGGGSFSLGSTGGPLFAGIIIGHIGKIGKYSLRVPGSTLTNLRELGLILFLIGAGTEAGQGFIMTIREYGIVLFFQGVIITLFPMISASLVAIKIFKMDLINILGCICGGMTSTPALGTLISTAKTDEVTVAYASTYPIALILVVFGTQFLIAIL